MGAVSTTTSPSRTTPWTTSDPGRSSSRRTGSAGSTSVRLAGLPASLLLGRDVQVRLRARGLLLLGPYLWVNFWLVLYTWLQHTSPEVPHFGDDEWTWVRGALCTIDRPYAELSASSTGCTTTSAARTSATTSSATS